MTESDVVYDTTQKGVDIKYCLDIASLAYKRLVDRVVLITGDADFVPAAKLARREGLDVVLDPLWNHVSSSLHEHVDGLKTVWPKPGPTMAKSADRAKTSVPETPDIPVPLSASAPGISIKPSAHEARGDGLRTP